MEAPYAGMAPSMHDLWAADEKRAKLFKKCSASLK
jgi:hypothetical protein